jgi:hypothetical protein
MFSRAGGQLEEDILEIGFAGGDVDDAVRPMRLEGSPSTSTGAFRRSLL